MTNLYLQSDGKGPLQDFKILIAEDDSLQAKDLTNLIGMLGASIVGPCATTSQSIQLLKSSLVDFAVVDLKLADCLSISLMDEIENRGIPFAIITAYFDHPQASEKKAVARFEKPINYGMLIDAIKSRLLRPESNFDSAKSGLNLDRKHLTSNQLAMMRDVLFDPSRPSLKNDGAKKVAHFLIEKMKIVQ